MEVLKMLVVVTLVLVLFAIVGKVMLLYGRLILWGSLAKEKCNRQLKWQQRIVQAVFTKTWTRRYTEGTSQTCCILVAMLI